MKDKFQQRNFNEQFLVDKLSRYLDRSLPQFKDLCERPEIDYKLDIPSICIALWFQMNWQADMPPLYNVFGLLHHLLSINLLRPDQTSVMFQSVIPRKVVDSLLSNIAAQDAQQEVVMGDVEAFSHNHQPLLFHINHMLFPPRKLT